MDKELFDAIDPWLRELIYEYRNQELITRARAVARAYDAWDGHRVSEEFEDALRLLFEEFEAI